MDGQLSVCLEEIVAEILPGFRIERVSREQSRFASWYATEVLTVRFESGDALTVFRKDFGSFDRAKDGMRQRRERELRVYRDLLADAGLETAAFYGAAWDEERGRFWLFLEYLRGMPVKYREFEDWLPAARWLALMQAHFAERPEKLADDGFLLRHDAAFFAGKAEDAVRAATLVSPTLGEHLGPVARVYPRVVERLAARERTFVHGAYRPGQILLDDGPPTRICPVDWELAAIGSPLFDLAELSDGFDSGRVGRLVDAYRSHALALGLDVPAADEIVDVLEGYRLARTLDLLSKAYDRDFGERSTAGLVRTALELAASVA